MTDDLKQHSGTAMGVAGSNGRPAAAFPSSFILQPSPFRAWLALVTLSWRRQARSRQMVWVALVLLAVALAMVVLQTQAGRWGMHHWRRPGRGPNYVQWGYMVQAATCPFPNAACQTAGPTLLLGAYQTVLSPEARISDGPRAGQRLAWSATLVFTQVVVFSALLTFLLPVWSLAFATEAIGGEREGRGLIWLLSRPLPRWAIYLAKFVALLPWSVGLCLGGFALLCAAAGTPGLLALRLFWPAVLWATLAFTALFLLVGAYFRWPAVVAIVYSFCLEVVLGSMPGYLKRGSIGFYARCLMLEAGEPYGIQPDNPSVFLPVAGPTALAVLIGGSVALLGLGMWVFTRTEYHEVD